MTLEDLHNEDDDTTEVFSDVPAPVKTEVEPEKSWDYVDDPYKHTTRARSYSGNTESIDNKWNKYNL
jgi:hypothetical protein